MPTEGSAKGVVLLLAPTRSDAAVAARVLEKADVITKVCSNLVDLAQELNESTDALLVAEEALVPDELLVLLDALAEQPPWSDVPIIVLTSSAGSEGISRHALEIFGPNANVTLLERPLHATTLVSSMQVAARARRRQRQLRDLIEQRETILTGISDAFSALDRDWRYTFVNEKVAELAGLPKDKMIGRVIWEIFPDAVGGEFYKRCHKAMATNVLTTSRSLQTVEALAGYPDLSNPDRPGDFPRRYYVPKERGPRAATGKAGGGRSESREGSVPRYAFS